MPIPELISISGPREYYWKQLEFWSQNTWCPESTLPFKCWCEFSEATYILSFGGPWFFSSDNSTSTTHVTGSVWGLINKVMYRKVICKKLPKCLLFTLSEISLHLIAAVDFIFLKIQNLVLRFSISRFRVFCPGW